ncbi:MAG: hypothetical protein KA257_11240, partial [Opitutaceae bacterium]|nr:hypothetical protein [Opitutaceae bacterium]
YDFLIGKHIATESPLTQWLHANFTPAFAIETYEFWVRNGRTIAALGTAQIREAESSSSPRYKLSVILAQPNLRNVTQVTLGQLDGDLSHVRLVWDRHNATIRITPINSAGNPRGPDAAAAWPFSAPELVKIELFTDVLPDHFRPGISIVHFRDATGQALAEARFVN